MSISRKTRDLVLTRAMGYCEYGGEPLTAPEETALHHRKLRSHGGRDTPDNLLVVCHAHHNLASDSIHLKVAKAHIYGYIVTGGQEPEAVLVRIHKRHWAYLSRDGSYHEPSPELLALITTIGGVR